jgi:hypothetical protein
VNRHLLAAFVGVMLVTVTGQALKLRQYVHRPVTQVELHESRLVLFLQEIRGESPLTYDSILLNLSRIRDAQPEDRYRLEERLVAKALIARLEGRD